MKNRKRIVVAFLLCAMLLISVGFAAVTNVLDIQGSASVSATTAEEEFNEDIYFTGVVSPADGTGATIVSNFADDGATKYGYTANINTNNNDKAQFTVNSLANKNDSVTITYQIANDSEHVATVSLKTITNTNGTTQGATGTGDFDFDYYFGTAGTKTVQIAAGQKATVSVTIKLLNQLTSASSGSFVLELNATAGN
ncbi:MAG: hypothetical protein IKC32_04600 [Clostridia bacterium]|nr:hypothetical protein [Clostridia bacterium]